MRRVVVTGVGVVSSIGSNAAEVTEALKEGRSGITFAEDFAELGFRCQVKARPTLDYEAVLDRRTRRFMGEGAGWNYIAMQEAIADAGLAEDEISHPMTGIIMGSGGPSTRAIVEAADKTRESKSTKKIGPTQVPKAMSSTNSATLAVAYKILGINYSISS
ncbi:MAG TPA: beta-ketoacyl synthase N-terminal-like domain-containing protein, partial [Parvularculaceae bacterium]|nr:beta-ketoacyl synthase N-terminal-like domain-containing protein [Parvularculaceae bacterium]